MAWNDTNDLTVQTGDIAKASQLNRIVENLKHIEDGYLQLKHTVYKYEIFEDTFGFFFTKNDFSTGLKIHAVGTQFQVFIDGTKVLDNGTNGTATTVRFGQGYTALPYNLDETLGHIKIHKVADSYDHDNNGDLAYCHIIMGSSKSKNYSNWMS